MKQEAINILKHLFEETKKKHSKSSKKRIKLLKAEIKLKKEEIKQIKESKEAFDFFENFATNTIGSFMEKEEIINFLFELSLEEQSLYVDGVCAENIDDDEFLNKNLQSEIKDISAINKTSIGNLAFVILNSNNEEAVLKAKKMLEQIKELSKE